MQRFPAVRATLSMLALFLTQCAGSPTLPRALTVTKGERTRVVLKQVAAGTTFTLQNESAGKRDDVYKDPKADRTTKVIADATLQNLLDVLAAESFFQRAGGGPAPGARELITVEQGDRIWVLSRGIPQSPEDPVYLAFFRCREYVLAAYNQETGFHADELSGEELKRQKEAVEQRANAARQKLQGGKNEDPPR